MMSDPIADMLVRLQNASRVRKADVSMPYSRLKQAVAKVLEQEGYVADVSAKKTPPAGGSLTLSLIYKDGRPAINGIKRVSKPSRRMYMGVRDVRPVKRGHGLLVLSTPAGVLSGKEARAKRVGGEVLFEIW